MTYTTLFLKSLSLGDELISFCIKHSVAILTFFYATEVVIFLIGCVFGDLSLGRELLLFASNDTVQGWILYLKGFITPFQDAPLASSLVFLHLVIFMGPPPTYIYDFLKPFYGKKYFQFHGAICFLCWIYSEFYCHSKMNMVLIIKTAELFEIFILREKEKTTFYAVTNGFETVFCLVALSQSHVERGLFLLELPYWTFLRFLSSVSLLSLDWRRQAIARSIHIYNVGDILIAATSLVTEWSLLVFFYLLYRVCILFYHYKISNS